MSLFSTNWRIQITRLLPARKRSTSVIDWLTALSEPVETKSTEMAAFDAEIRKRALWNGQIVVLQAALNNIFGVVSAPFILVETRISLAGIQYTYNSAEGLNPWYVYNETEGNYDTAYFFNNAELDDGNDFVVRIPAGIYTAELDRRIKAEVRTYKLAGKSFTTETY